MHVCVSETLISDTFAAGDSFFALPEAEKARLDIRKNPHNRGWAAFGSENLDDSSDQVDAKEAFNVGWDLAADDPRVLAGEPFRGVNVWPELAGFRETLLSYYAAVHSLSVGLHRAIARDLDPTYGAAFDAARSAGVETICLDTKITTEGVEIGRPLPIEEP